MLLDPTWWCWPHVTPFLCLFNQRREEMDNQTTGSYKIDSIKWWKKILPPLPLGGIPSSTKLRHKRWFFSSSQSIIRQWRLMNGEVKSWRRLTKVALIVAHSWLSQWSIDSTIVHSLNKVAIHCQHHVATLCQKKGKLGPHKSFSTMQCLFDQPLCKTILLHLVLVEERSPMDYMVPTGCSSV